jgi:hypothetical protein
MSTNDPVLDVSLENLHPVVNVKVKWDVPSKPAGISDSSDSTFQNSDTAFLTRGNSVSGISTSDGGQTINLPVTIIIPANEVFPERRFTRHIQKKMGNQIPQMT